MLMGQSVFHESIRVALVVLFTAMAPIGFCSARDMTSDPSADAPRIMQILALPDGRIAALTPEKGGLYVSEPSGRVWHQWPEVPEVFIHHLALGPDQAPYLATPGGLLRWENQSQSWDRVMDGAVSRIFFGPPGSDVETATALIKPWGLELVGAPTRVLTADRLQEDRAARDKAREERAALERKAGELGRELRTLMPPSASQDLSLEESRDRMKKFAQWQALKRQVAALDRESDTDPRINMSQGLHGNPVQSAVIRTEGDWFAATFGQGVFRSRALGAPWEPASRGLTSPWILTLALSPQGTLYAGTYGGGLFHWTDEDSRWSMTDPLFEGADIQELAFGRRGEVLAAGARSGLFLSLDQGRSWRQVVNDLPANDVQSVAVGTDGSLWAGLWEQGLFVSNDSGVSWRYRPFAHVEHVADLAFSEDGIGYAVLAGLGVFRSLDGGNRWMRLHAPVRPARDLRLAVAPDGRVFLGSPREGLWSSDSRGEQWARDMGGLTGEGVQAIMVSPAGTLLTIPADASGLYERSESGQWRLIPLIDEDEKGWSYSVWELLFLPDGRGVAAGHTDMLLSDDGGRTWARKHFGQPFRALAVDASGTIYTQRLMSTFALRRGTEEWEEVLNIPLDAYRFFRALDQKHWIAARLEIGVDLLVAERDSLTVSGTGLMSRRVLSLSVAPNGSVFAGFRDGILVSRDRGQSWQPVRLFDD